MSIFTIQDIDKILLSFCDLIDDYAAIKNINKYYYQLIINNLLYKSLAKLFVHSKSVKYHNSLFIHACQTNNILCEYIIKKFTDINIHMANEYPFQLSCQCGNLNLAKLLINLGKKSDSLIDIHADEEYAFRLSCEYGNLHVALWLCSLSSKYRVLDYIDGRVSYEIKN
jgi:hypothetical protein